MQHDEHVWAWRWQRFYLAGLYAYLSVRQEALGEPFQSVLTDNAWDLYAR